MKYKVLKPFATFKVGEEVDTTHDGYGSGINDVEAILLTHCGFLEEVKEEEEEFIFVECDTCRAKSGSPYLCQSCLHNRNTISRARDAIKKFVQGL